MSASPSVSPSVSVAGIAGNVDPRTRRLLEGPLLRTLLGMAWPNVLVMLAQASTGLIETWLVSRLGTEALSGIALVLPLLMLMQNMSQGAMGGGIASAIARSLGAGRRDQADSLVAHALIVNGSLGLAFAIVVTLAGSQIFGALGGSGATLDHALAYSSIVFAGAPLLWLFNGFASILRGTGNMIVPGIVFCGGAALLVPLSAALIFGFGPIPALGMSGAGLAIVLYNAAGVLILGSYVLRGRSTVRLRKTRLQWPLFRDILTVGGVALVNPIQVNATIAGTLALVAGHAGTAALAGFGTGTRLEYLLAPLAFGLGAPLVTLVGANLGAGQNERALRVAKLGGLIAFTLTETLGLLVAIWPEAWLSLFGSDPLMLATGTSYMRTVGPFYGFFGMGMALYFASQGAGRLGWPLIAGLSRLTLSLAGGWLILSLTGSLAALFCVYAAGMVSYGAIITTTVVSGSWFRRPATQPVVAAPAAR